MVFPADKETWRRVEGKDLPLGKLGDVVEDTDHNDFADFLERLQDVLGLTILAGFGSVKLRLADMDTQIGLAGDFKADGSVPMTGNLDLNSQELISVKKILGYATNLMEIDSHADYGLILMCDGDYNIKCTKGGTTVHTYVDFGINPIYNISDLKGTEAGDFPIRGESGRGIKLYGNSNTLAIEIKSTGNTEIANDLKVLGDTSIKTYAQIGEPALDTDGKCCFWKDTDDANKIYLVYRRGVGDQVKIQLV